jgi:5-methylcytosine-specific restriction endonuclease McrA
VKHRTFVETRNSSVARFVAGSRSVGTRAAYREALRRDPCAYCGGPTESRAFPSGTLDHIDHERRGLADWTNLIGACADCNAGKGTSSLLGFLGWRRARATDVEIGTLAALLRPDELDEVLDRALRRAWRQVGA